MKKIFRSTFFLITIGVLISQSAGSLYALTTDGGQGLLNSVNRMQSQASNTAARQQTRLQDIITRSNTLIATRLTSLNDVTTRIQNDTNLSASEKNTLASDVQSDISGLTALQTKIDADTDVATARADEKTIITNYYIYEMFIPKIRLLIILNNLQTISGNIQSLIPQLQNLINTFQSQGGNVTQLQTLLTNISTQLQIINTTLSTDTNTVQNVTISTTDPASTYSQVRQDISSIVRADLTTIKSDFSQMRPLFKQLELKISLTPGVSPTLTPTP